MYLPITIKLTDLFWSDDARAVGSDESGLVLSDESVLDSHHVLLRDTLSDADDERHLCVDSLEDSLGSAGRRHVDNRGFRSGSIPGLVNNRGSNMKRG